MACSPLQHVYLWEMTVYLCLVAIGGVYGTLFTLISLKSKIVAPFLIISIVAQVIIMTLAVVADARRRYWTGVFLAPV